MSPDPRILLLLLAACSGGGTDPNGPASVALSASQTILVPGETVQLAWIVKDGSGNTLPNAAVSFVSSSPGTATVSGGGAVTGVATGNVSITARAGDASGQLAMAVTAGGIVSPAGATLTGFGGAITLLVPAGAVSVPTAIRLSVSTNPLLDPTAASGSVYDVGPAGFTFAQPATVRVRFSPGNGPVGLPVSGYGLRRFAGGAWVAIPGGTIDAPATVAEAPLTGPALVSAGWVPPAGGCTDPRHRQFDFWIGAWAVGTGGAPFAQSDITATPDGCAILEHYRTNGGEVGRSINFFEPSTSTWYQTYIDNSPSGGRINLGGTLNGDAMELLAPPGGGANHQLWRWTREGSNVRQVGSATSNGGASYSAPFWNGIYTPR